MELFRYVLSDGVRKVKRTVRCHMTGTRKEGGKMIEFGGENKEINEKCKGAPFLLSLEDNPDNVLRVVIAFPMEGGEGERLEDFLKS